MSVVISLCQLQKPNIKEPLSIFYLLIQANLCKKHIGNRLSFSYYYYIYSEKEEM